MASRTHIFPSALAILAVCAVALGSHGQKRPAPPARKPLPTLSAQEIFKRVSPSIMVVESLDAKGKVTMLGSGVVIAPGRVITNRHVIEDGASFRIEHDGKKWLAKVVRVDPDHDLAELSVAGLGAPVVAVLDSSNLAVGETVYAIGAPEGLELTISEGLISGLRDFDKVRVIQTSAAISPGSSGGGLFDAQGRLVGITTFYLKEGQSLNFALPAEWTLALNQKPPDVQAAASQNSPEFQALVSLQWGYFFLDGGKYAQAAQDFREATQMKPDYDLAWLDLGVAYDHLGRYGDALSAYQTAILLKPDVEVAWASLGVDYTRLGQYDKAVSAYQEAIRLRPANVAVLSGLGVAYARLGQYDKAVSAEQEAVCLEPSNADAWVSLGLAYGSLRNYDKEVSTEQQALRLKPDDAEAWDLLGLAYGSLGQYEKAVSAGQKATLLKPDDPTAWFDLGLAYKFGGRSSEVIPVYEKLKILDPALADKFFKAAVLP